MKVRVVGVTWDQAGAPVVAFTSALGTASARWANEAQRPEVGKEYDVELDVDLTLDKGANAHDAEVDEPRLLMEGDNVVLRGLVEAVEDDGLAFFRLAEDCLVMIDTAGNVSSGDVIQITVPLESFSITAIGFG